MTDAPLEAKACNALIVDAQPDFALYSAAAKILGLDPAKEVLEPIIKAFGAFYGGLWVGGVAKLTASQLSFTPNLVNKLLHKDDCAWSIPLEDIADLSLEFGVLTGIICVKTERGTAKLRCFGARGFLSRIAQRRETQQPPKVQSSTRA